MDGEKAPPHAVLPVSIGSSQGHMQGADEIGDRVERIALANRGYRAPEIHLAEVVASIESLSPDADDVFGNAKVFQAVAVQECCLADACDALRNIHVVEFFAISEGLASNSLYPIEDGDGCDLAALFEGGFAYSNHLVALFLAEDRVGDGDVTLVGRVAPFHLHCPVCKGDDVVVDSMRFDGITFLFIAE